jgi:multidrug transporter EmrE-like cation transporter
MAKKKFDFVDKMIQSVNWNIGKFSTLPIFFGTLMALLDILMMGTLKMVSTGSMSRELGIPLSVALYALEPLVFLKALNYEGMVVTNLVWNLMSNIIVTLQGIFMFGESIKGLRWVGVLMSLFSLALMAYTDSE